MNEELTLAINELRQRRTDRIWFIPVKLNNCEIPDFAIGGGETLQAFQYVNLYEDWNSGIQRILRVVQPASSEPVISANAVEQSRNGRSAHRMQMPISIKAMLTTGKVMMTVLLQTTPKE